MSIKLLLSYHQLLLIQPQLDSFSSPSALLNQCRWILNLVWKQTQYDFLSHDAPKDESINHFYILWSTISNVKLRSLVYLRWDTILESLSWSVPLGCLTQVDRELTPVSTSGCPLFAKNIIFMTYVWNKSICCLFDFLINLSF